jgi:hypothetical protein
MSYNRMDHARWVESNNEASNHLNARRKSCRLKPEKLSEFQAKVMDICGMVGGGIYNAPINWDKVEWGVGHHHSGMFVPWRDGRMSTFDFYPLTMLVLLCHEARIRCEIRAKASGHFELSFFQRSHEGGMSGRHPNIDEAVAAFREYLPADHRIIYRSRAETGELANDGTGAADGPANSARTESFGCQLATSDPNIDKPEILRGWRWLDASEVPSAAPSFNSVRQFSDDVCPASREGVDNG